jgi:hypothetical protein
VQARLLSGHRDLLDRPMLDRRGLLGLEQEGKGIRLPAPLLRRLRLRLVSRRVVIQVSVANLLCLYAHDY